MNRADMSQRDILKVLKDKAAQKAQDLDNLFTNTTQKVGELAEDAGQAVGKASTMKDKLISAAKTGKEALKKVPKAGALTTTFSLANLNENLNKAGSDTLSKANDIASTVAGVSSLAPVTPVTWAGIGTSVARGNRAEQIRQDNLKWMNDEYNTLVNAGIKPEVAFANTYGQHGIKNPSEVGINLNAKPQVQQPVQQSIQQKAPASTPKKNETMKEKMAREKAEDTQNLPSASGGVENLINKQRAKYGAYEGTEEEVPTALPESLPTGQAAPVEQTIPSEQSVPMEQVVQKPVQNTPIRQSDLDLINAIQAGYINQQDIYDRINQAQQRLYDTINQGDYRYRGDIVQPQNPYQVDIDRLQADQNAYRNRANLDWLLGRTSAPDQRAMELENARQLYQAQLANQIGVPYEDYAGAMADRRAEQIKAQSQEAINQLQFMQNQTNDMKEKLAYASKIKEIQQKTDDAIMKTLLESKRAIDVANIQAGSAANVANINALSSQNVAQMNNTARILEEEMKLQDPVTQMKNISTTAMQLGYVPKEALMAFFNVNRNARLAMFGQDASPEQIAQTFGNIPQQQANNLFIKLQSMFGGN